jgi:CHAD domain
MKARKVKALDPHGTLTENARLIVRVRLDELYSFVPQALDPAEEKALHDMRIAAKRLRYVLELTGFCFGPYARKAAKIARELQDMIGAIHDCDVLGPRVLEYLAEMRAREAELLAAAALSKGADDPPRLPPDRRQAHSALDALAVDQRARRDILFERFIERWAQLQRNGFRKRLETALHQPPLSVAA